MAVQNNVRLGHAGGADKTFLTDSIDIATITIGGVDFTNWYSGSNPAAAIINRGAPNEEKIFYQGITSNVLQGVTRGADGSSPQTHAAGEPIEHGFSAKEADEANALVAAANTANTWNASYSVLDGDNFTISVGSHSYTYYQIGKLVHISAHALLTLSGGSGPGLGAGGVGISMPVPANLHSDFATHVFAADCQNGTARATFRGGSPSLVNVYQIDTRNGGKWYVDGIARWFRITGWYEAA